jgi:hypothetical protein
VSEIIVAVCVLLVETVVVSAVAGVTDLCTGARVLLLSTPPDFQLSLVLLLFLQPLTFMKSMLVLKSLMLLPFLLLLTTLMLLVFPTFLAFVLLL